MAYTYLFIVQIFQNYCYLHFVAERTVTSPRPVQVVTLGGAI